eukprot:6177847-Pleurochrysis_carterae.AAC.4
MAYRSLQLPARAGTGLGHLKVAWPCHVPELIELPRVSGHAEYGFTRHTKVVSCLATAQSICQVAASEPVCSSFSPSLSAV